MIIRVMKSILVAGVLSLCIAVGVATSQENGSGTALEGASGQSTSTASSYTTAAEDEKRKIREIEEKQKEVEARVEEEAKDVQKAQEHIAEVQTEKELLKKEVDLTKEEAALAKKELEIVKKEAEVTKDRSIQKKVEELQTEVQKAEEAKQAQARKLDLALEKERLAEKKLDKEQREIDQMKQQLSDLRLQRSGMRSTTEKLISSAVIILVGMVLYFLLGVSVKALERMIKKGDDIRESEAELRFRTLGKLIKWLGGITIILSVVYLLLSLYGFNVAPLIAGAGVIGLAFGFGGQYLIRDLINGMFILIEGQYRINDVVKLGDLAGLVEDVNLRITTLRDLEGRVITVPNGEIKAVINYTKGYAQALFDIGVAYKENVDHVMEVIREVGAQIREDAHFGKLILSDLEMFGVDSFADSAVVIKFRIKTRPIKQWEVSREFRRRLKNRFDELGIEIPFPHRTVYWGTGEDNKWVRDTVEKVSGV
ncbi:MAG: mechanosensitive ion channel [Candidatus Omnitrophica bacterium]|nr:mechanosensitive ion channel [Candidatus Omnitrophota bacterium]